MPHGPDSRGKPAYQVIKDKDGHIRMAGPRAGASHTEVFDFWPTRGLAYCLCVKCDAVWREGATEVPPCQT